MYGNYNPTFLVNDRTVHEIVAPDRHVRKHVLTHDLTIESTSACTSTLKIADYLFTT